MSREYNQYIKKHKLNVIKGFEWIRDYAPELLVNVDECEINILKHDNSKYDIGEYEAYDNYFYGNIRSYDVVNNFNKAWLEHIHKNPHHWQHWILINDEPNKKEIILDMPLKYIIEMICDWWSFSWQKGDLYELFKWYDEHKDHMKLSPDTRHTVEYILTYIERILHSTEETGIK